MRTEVLEFCDRMVGVGFNGLWQGLLITALVALGLRLLGPTNAATRHATWLVTLLICIGLFPAQLLRRTPPADTLVTTTERSASVEANSAPEVAGLVVAEPAGVEGATTLDATVELTPGNQVELPLQSDGPPDSWIAKPPGESLTPSGNHPSTIQIVRRHPIISHRIGPVAPTPVAQSGLPTLSANEPVSPKTVPRTVWGTNWRVPLGTRLPRATGLVILVCWLMATVVRLVMLAHRLIQIRRMKRSSVPASAELTEVFDALRRRLGIERSVSLRVSGSDVSPALLGFIHPVIMIPEYDFEAASLPDAEKVLWHEMAHLRRYDDWANLVQNFIQAVAFFHPAVQWISRRLSLEREIACDDYVLQGGKPRAYALLLANLADRFQGNRALPAPGVTTTRSQLHQRINMILNTKRNTSPRLAGARLGLVSTTAFALAALAVYCGPRVVLAQNSADNAAQSANANENRNDSLSTASAGGLVAVAGAPTAPVAAEAPDAPNAGVATSGPRVKPELSIGIAAPHPMVLTAPSQPGADNVAVIAVPTPPTPSYGMAQSVPAGQKIRPADAAPTKALEARLERVEAMLNELLAQRRGGDGPNAFGWGKSGEDMKRQAEQMALMERKKAELDGKQAEQEAKMDAKMKLKAGSMDAKKQREACSKALEALQRSREQLEKQMEKLDQQIEKLEQEQENLDESSQSSEEQEESKAAK